MKERPIPFNAEMVRAILAKRKTQTRRVVKWPVWANPDDHLHRLVLAVREGLLGIAEYVDGRPRRRMTCPYGQPGDRLWVKETFICSAENEAMIYRADGERFYAATAAQRKWLWGKTVGQVIPSIFMPRWASRINLEVVEVRVERVQDISIDDIEREGVYKVEDGQDCSRDTFLNVGNFMALWDSINAKRGHGWDVNPWVWVVEFNLLEDTT